MNDSVLEDKTGSGKTAVADNASRAIEASSAVYRSSARITPASSPKGMARSAMRRLKDNGVDLSNSSAGNSILFYLASVEPDLMNRIVDAAVSAGKEESKTWLYYLGDWFAPEKSSPKWDTDWKKYQYLEHLIPTTSYLESTSSHAQYSHQAKRLISLVEDAYPEHKGDVAFMRAAAIVLHLKGENTPFANRRKNYDYSIYLTDIEYIAEHVDEVEKIVHVLRERKTTDRGAVEAILSSSATSLVSGSL